MSHPTGKLTDAIPDPAAIRRRLAQLMREQDVLRALLRIAERTQQQGAAAPAAKREGAADA